jgi:hypothetical protein
VKTKRTKRTRTEAEKRAQRIRTTSRRVASIGRQIALCERAASPPLAHIAKLRKKRAAELHAYMIAGGAR